MDDEQYMTFVKASEDFNNSYGELTMNVLMSFANPVSGLRREYYEGISRDFELIHFKNELIGIKIIVYNEDHVLQSQGTFYK